jgi:AcrR family transcriptional regulator
VSGHSALKIAPSWAGRPPADDAEATQRIRDAARRCIDRGGVNVRIAEVARELGVSRPTIYRHYASGRAVLLAVALESIEPLRTRVASMDLDLRATPAEVAAEVGCLLFEWLSRDPQLRQLTRFGAGAATDDVTSSAALLLTRGLIERAGACAPPRRNCRARHAVGPFDYRTARPSRSSNGRTERDLAPMDHRRRWRDPHTQCRIGKRPEPGAMKPAIRREDGGTPGQ